MWWCHRHAIDKVAPVPGPAPRLLRAGNRVTRFQYQSVSQWQGLVIEMRHAHLETTTMQNCDSKALTRDVMMLPPWHWQSCTRARTCLPDSEVWHKAGPAALRPWSSRPTCWLLCWVTKWVTGWLVKQECLLIGRARVPSDWSSQSASWLVQHTW